MSFQTYSDMTGLPQYTDNTSSEPLPIQDTKDRTREWIYATRESDFGQYELILSQTGPLPVNYPSLSHRSWLHEALAKEPSRAVISGSVLAALFDLDLVDTLKSLVPLEAEGLDSTRKFLDFEIRFTRLPRGIEFFPIAIDFDAESRGSERRVPLQEFELAEVAEEPVIRPALSFIFGSVPINVPKRVTLTNDHLNALRAGEQILPQITLQLEES